MTSKYNSNILKADRRIQRTESGCIAYLSANNENINVVDVYLSAGAGTSLSCEAGALSIIFPIVGTLLINGDIHFLAPEELYCCTNSSQQQISIINPIANTTVNFLHITIKKHNITNMQDAVVEKISLNTKNCLIPASGIAGCIKAGIYDSRAKDKTTLSPSCTQLFTYIINGSFDFEERLIEYRDCLYQWDISEVDFEALSETAIILLIECSS